MEVESVEAIPVAHSLSDGRRIGGTRGITGTRSALLLRVETRCGEVGWGEALAPVRTAEAAVEEIVEQYVIGRSIHDTANLATEIYRGDYHFARGPIVHSVLSAIDIALWDLKGKELGEPIYRLLGVPNSDSFIDGSDETAIRPYASTMYITEWEENPAEPITAAVGNGFEAVKIKIGRGIQDDRHRVSTARDILGSDGKIMVDFNGNYRPSQAARAIQEIESFDITWAEEPVPPENPEGYDAISRRTDVPLAAGEAHYNRFEFKDLIQNRTVDIVQPNVTHCGGLSEARFIAKLATTENIGVFPHTWNGAVGFAATLQFVASLPTYPHAGSLPEQKMVECDRSENPLRDQLIENPIDPTGGEVSAPDGPGLGVEVDEAAVEEFRIH